MRPLPMLGIALLMIAIISGVPATGVAETEPQAQAINACAKFVTRPQYAAFVRREYAEPFISKAEMDFLAKQRACARTPTDRQWMIKYGHKIHDAYGEKRLMARLWRHCGDSPDERVKSCIKYAALKFDQPLGDMMRVANCESGRRPKASGHHQGMYQYLWSTWASTPYGNKSPYSARWNSLATAWMWSVGRRGEWACQ